MKVPYLNWWLFKEEYPWWESYVTKISNDIFSNKKEKWDDADWILDIFDRYNFTIDEDSLYDRDVAVDPEMLGKIFENMISISEENIEDVVKIYDSKKKWAKIDFWKALNKDLWAFYTPREIVHYMTRESLIAYLVSNLKWNSSENESLIRDLFDLKEKFLLSSDDMKKSWYSEEQLKKLSEIIIDVDNALSSVKILDPAIWSWAFPMWILHEISSLRYYMYWTFFRIFWDKTVQYKNDRWNISLYKIKRDIILNSIYGVDIDPWAIDIARLRFWLSLVVDAEEPEPLPNFEFKFVCANTLLPLKDSAREKDLFSMWDEPKLETLKRYKRDFYNADKKIEKKQLKERIREYTKIEHTLFSEPTPRAKQMEEFWKFFDNPKHSHSFFDSWLMLSESKWFDIVIWNPPILRGRDIKKYWYEFADLWLINSHNWIKAKWIKPIDIDDYPAIKNHLNQYREKIEKRDDKWVTPYNLRNCAYTEDFYMPKIMYSEIVREPQFYFDGNWEFFAEATTFIITSKSNNIEELKYLIALLNSNIVAKCFKLFYAWWWLWSSWYRYKKQFIENLCLPKYDNSDLNNKIMENQDCEVFIKDLFWLTDEETNYLVHL